MLKEILIFTAGVGVGAGVTYLILNDKYDQMYKAAWAETHAEAEKKIQDMEASVREREAVAADIVIKNLPYAADAITPTENPFPAEEADGVDLSPQETRLYPKEAENGIYLIAENEYSETNLHYDKEELYYFAQDRVIADAEEEMLDASIWDLIGPDAIPELEASRDYVYVRNEKMNTDYEICFCDKSWIDTH